MMRHILCVALFLAAVSADVTSDLAIVQRVFDAAGINQTAECGCTLRKFSGTCGVANIACQDDADGSFVWSLIMPQAGSSAPRVANTTGSFLHPDIGLLVELNRLKMEGLGLGGPLPSSLGNLTDLAHLLLNNNQFTGEIPEEIGNLTKLKTVDIRYSLLEGALPCSLRNALVLSERVTSVSNCYLTQDVSREYEVGKLCCPLNFTRENTDYPPNLCACRVPPITGGASNSVPFCPLEWGLVCEDPPAPEPTTTTTTTTTTGASTAGTTTSSASSGASTSGTTTAGTSTTATTGTTTGSATGTGTTTGSGTTSTATTAASSSGGGTTATSGARAFAPVTVLLAAAIQAVVCL